MPREYYDRGLPTKKLHPANVDQQAAYDLLRQRLIQELHREWNAILKASPAIQEASQSLDTYVERHSSRSFTIFRPEDARATHEAGGPLFLR